MKPSLILILFLALFTFTASAKEQKVYKKLSKEEAKKVLTPEQYRITKEQGTEQAFNNAYWDKKDEGIYVDVTTGEPLFSSTDKYDSGTGWPSFTKPIAKENIEAKADTKLFERRTEVRAKNGDVHLGHVFNDGPGPTGERFCINSGALRFVPKNRMKAEGYDEYLYLFIKK